jgi:hypothetical protein
MQAPIIRDSLWLCLCPLYRPTTISNAIRSSGPRTLRGYHHLIRPATCSASSVVPIQHSTTVTSQYRKRHISPVVPTVPRGFLSKASPVKGPLAELDTTSIYENLRIWAASGDHAKVIEAVQYLINERQEHPNVRLYSALILVNVSPTYGTAGRVAALLQDMRDDRMEPDAGTCHDILEVPCCLLPLTI